jgi:hypothetical protein
MLRRASETPRINRAPPRCAVALSLLALLLADCARPQPVRLPPPPTPEPGIYYEEELRPAQPLRIEILDLQQQPGVEPGTVLLVGTLINRGERASTDLSVKIDALDEADQTVFTAPAAPSRQRVEPDTTATFRAIVEDRPEVRRYHVEAIAR